MDSPERIGLLGGSFNPVHTAHLALARTAVVHLALDQLLWVPAGDPWQKRSQDLAPAEHRAAMVSLAIEGEPRFALERCELERKGPSYTVDTVNLLRRAHADAEFFLLLGQDQYARLQTWHAWQELIGLVTLAVAAREGRTPQPAAEVAAVPHRLEVLPLPEMAVSATEIRVRLARGEPASALVPSLVPAEVARYIDQHRLYAGAPNPPRS